MSRFIHLLYVPTMACNMRCAYCYLGEQTVENYRDRDCLETLQFAVKKFKDAGVVPFNISLHGGEVTTLSPDDFRRLIAYIAEYYKLNRSLLQEFGFRVGGPHIKTNLYRLTPHLDAIRDYNVSISGSLDLPLSLHSQYRLNKAGQDVLPEILKNVQALAELPCHKKVSATIFREHMARLDEIIRDITWLHENTCLDMNDFNFMFGFATPDAYREMTPLTREEQVEFFNAMRNAFDGTDLQPGLDKAWFAEFTPDYCTGCANCGEKFFLLERNGDVYSCVRGQGHKEFYYGNVYKNTVEEILENGRRQILAVQAAVGFDERCGKCPNLYHCKTGCPFVKYISKDPLSYTCLLQKELYKRIDLETPPQNYVFQYLSEVRPEKAEAYFDPPDVCEDGTPSLTGLIKSDPKLAQVYDPNAFILQIDGRDRPLRSQLLKLGRETATFVPGATQMAVYVRKDVMKELCDDPVYNALYVMLLSGDMVVYGDEKREKQAHVMTHLVFQFTLERMPSDRDGYYKVPLERLLSLYAGQLGKKPANLFFTTTALRDYHYYKQKNNGYYHRLAINLPFQNVELACLQLPSVKEN